MTKKAIVKKPITKIDKVYNLISSGKKIKLSTIAKKIYNSTDFTSLDNARRIINHLKNDYNVKIKLVDTSIYQAK